MSRISFPVGKASAFRKPRPHCFTISRLYEPENEGRCLPYAHYHDLQGAFDIPGFSRFEGNIAQIPADQLVSLRLACAVSANGRLYTFLFGGGMHTVLSTVGGDAVPHAGIADHLECLAAHLRNLFPGHAVGGVIWPYGLVVHRDEDFSLSPRSVLTCGHAVRYVYVVELSGDEVPVPEAIPAEVAPGAFRNGEVSLMEDVLQGASAGLRRHGGTTIAPFPPEVRRLHARRFSAVVCDGGEEGEAASKILIDVFPTPVQ